MVIRGKEVDFRITRLKDAARFEAAKAEFEGNKDNLSGNPVNRSRRQSAV